MEALFNSISSMSFESTRLAINMVWLGLAITVVFGLLWRFARPGQATVRYAAWWSVLTVVLLLPLVVTSSAGQLLRESLRPARQEVVDRPVSTGSFTPKEEFAAKPVTHRESSTTPVTRSRSHSVAAAAAKRTTVSEPAVDRIERHEAERSLGSVVVGLLPLTLLTVWLSVTAVLVLRLGRAHRRMAQIKRNSRRLDFSLWLRLKQLLDDSPGSRRVEIMVSSDIDLPVAAGLGRPVILIPERLLEQLTATELEAVVRHELAHINRWDDWTKLVQKLVEAAAFFHPAVRWICRQLDLEREMACDEQVVRATGDAAGYARCLTRLAQLTTESPTALVPGVMNSHKQIFKRVGSLLNRAVGHPRYSRTRMAALVLSVFATLFLVLQAAPVIAVPGHAVTLEELSNTVRSILPAPSAEEPPEAVPSAEPEEIVPAEAPAPIIDPAPSPDEIVSPPLADAEAPPAPTHRKSRRTTEIQTELPKDADKWERVVDWSDPVFTHPISGVIRGKDDQPSTVVWTDDDALTRIAMQGRVRFSTDNEEIKSIAKDGFVAVRQVDKDGAVCCELDVVRGEDRKLEYHYFSKGKPAVFDKDALRWLRRILHRSVPEMRVWSQSPSTNDGSSSAPWVFGSDAGRYAYVLDDESDVPQVVGIGHGDADVPGFVAHDGEEGPDVVTVDHLGVGNGYLVWPADNDENASADAPAYLDAGSFRDHKGWVQGAVDWAEDWFDGVSLSGNYVVHNDGRCQIVWSDGGYRYRVEIDGDIELSDDDRDIKSISRRGHLTIGEKHGSRRRELEIEPNRDGSLDYSYYLNGKSHDFDDEAREWLGNILLEVVRRTGLGAEKRVHRLYESGGVDAVLDETRQMESDYVKRIYFDELTAIDGLSDKDYSKIVNEVGVEIDSDYEKAEFLIGMADRFQKEPELLKQFVDVVGTIDSDYETRRVLSEISIGDDADPELIKTVLTIADEMDSDYEKAELLIEMAPLVTSDSTLLDAYVTAVEEIDSDYETRRVLNALALDDDVNEQLVLAVLRIAARMDSDYEKAELLIDMAPYSANYAAARQAYVDAVRYTDSDYETRRIISALSNKRELDRDAVEDLLNMADEMDSDYEKAELLIELSALCENDPELQKTLMKAAAKLDSDYETRRVLSNQRIDCENQPELTSSMVEVIDNLGSDYETAEVLLELTECAAANPEFREAYLEATDNLDSDYERKRVLTELIDEADEPDSGLVVGILSVVEDMDSDFEKVEVLSLLAPSCRGNDALEEAYSDVVETMDSDFEIDRAYSRLYRRRGSSGSRGD